MSNDANKVHQARLSAEIEVLRALCNRRGSREQRAELVGALQSYRFIEPEHQVLFESICTVSPQPEFSAALLAAHLNNRGFPDIDLGEYFVNEPPSLQEALILARTLSSLIV